MFFFKIGLHIVPFAKFHRIVGAPPKNFPIVKYDTPEEVGVLTKKLF